MGYKIPDEELIGKRIGKLLIISISGHSKTPKKVRMVMCQCDCGNMKRVRIDCIRKNAVKSCGCLKQKYRDQMINMYGSYNSSLLVIHRGIIERCENKKSTNYYRYGAIGIKICEEWKTNFISFYIWCMENGWEKGKQIDRFPDKLGNYEPTNCRITTRTGNARNKTNNRLIEYKGEIKCITEWSEVTGLSVQTIRRRLNKKWPNERIFKKSQKNKEC